MGEIIDRDKLLRANSLFSKSDEQGGVLTNAFETLGNTLLVRSMMFSKNSGGSKLQTRYQRLTPLFRHVGTRLSDLLLRVNLVIWMRRELPDSLTEPSWLTAGGLSIKDFHGDVSAVMDSIAPVIIESYCAFGQKIPAKLPGFADIQSGTQRSFRKKFDPEVVRIIDNSDRWWKPVKSIRDLLIHREHTKIVFGGPTDKSLFQIYQDDFKPVVVEQKFMWNGGRNVVDFQLYSGFVIAEILTLLDELGLHLAEHFGVATSTFVPSMRIGDFRSVIYGIDQLLSDANS